MLNRFRSLGWIKRTQQTITRGPSTNTKHRDTQTPPNTQFAQSLAGSLKTRFPILISPQAIDALLYEFQDKYIDLKRIRDRIQALGGVITDLNDAYLGEELFHKRVAFRAQQFLSHELDHLLQSVARCGIALKDFERYLHAAACTRS
jgi:hypothetical protein